MTDAASARGAHRFPAQPWWTTATAIVTTALVYYLWRPAAQLDLFFDEMWRVEQVRSADPFRSYLDGPAPIPPGWVITMSGVFDFLPDRRPLLRLGAVSLVIPAAIVFAITIRRVIGAHTSRHRAGAVALIAAPMTMAVPALALHMTYFNNYLTDVAVAVAILWALVTLDDPTSDSMAPWWTLLALSILAPWYSQGALFLLPGAAVLVYRHRHEQPRIALAAGISAVASSIIVGLLFLRPVANGATLTEFWRSETPAAGIAEFVRRFAATFVDAAYPQSLDGHPIALAALIGFSVVGAVVVQRGWRWWLPLYASAQILAVVTSVATGWPATFVRNNSSFQILVFALAPIGLGWIAVRGALRCRALTRSEAAAGALLVAVVLGATAVWIPRSIRANSASTEVFARGLTDDVSSFALRVEPGDLVAAHHLSGPYVRDRILNASDVADGVVVVDEARDGPLTDLGRRIDASTGSIWCVVPFEAGPDATADACEPPSAWSVVETSAGRRATIIELQRRP